MSQVSSKPQEERSHSPRGSGATVGYHKKGSPKQEPKKSLRPCKNRSQETTTGKPPPYPRLGWTARPASNGIPTHLKRARPKMKL